MDPSKSHLQLSTVLLAIGLVLASTIAIAAVFSEEVHAGEQITLSDSNNTLETLRIIDYEFSTRDIPEEKTAKLKIVLQNTDSDTAEGSMSLNSSPLGAGTVSLAPSSVNYSVNPGSRETYVFEISANRVGLNTKQFVDLSVNVNPDSGNAVTIDDPTPKNPNYPEDGTEPTVLPRSDPLSVYTLPKGSSVSEGSIEPTGERQSITKSFTSYKDNSDGNLGSYTNLIPPTTIQDGEYTNTSQGSIYNFLDSTSVGDGSYTRIESTTDGNINVGIASRNIPNSEHYTVQFRYMFRTDTLDEVKVNLVAQDGSEIDSDTTYVLNDVSPREKRTRYFQVSEEEADWIRENNSIFLTIENQELNTENEQLAVYLTQILSTEQPLEITAPNMNITDTRVLDMNGNDVTGSPSFSPQQTYQIEYTVENTGSRAGTKIVSLNEGGTIVKQSSIDLNPGETGTVTFEVNRGTSGVYKYNDPSGSLSDTVNVYVQGSDPLPPIATISLPPEPNQYPNDTLATDPKNPRLMTLYADESFAPNSTIDQYEWTFEWSGETVTTTNEYVEVTSPSTKGDYDVVLTVTNEEGVSDTTQQTLRAGTIGPNAPSRDDITIGNGEELLLDASGSSHPVDILSERCITEYTWQLSDGTVLANNTGTCDSPPSTTATYTFTEPGTYDLELVVTDDMNNTDSSLRQVQVDAPSPNAAITVGQTERLVNNTFTFDASNSFTEEGSITEYQWTMGDGTTYTTTEPTVDHTYSESGLYNPEVTVLNDLGGSDTATTSVSVIQEPFNIEIEGPTEGDTSDTLTFDNGPTDGRNNVDEWVWETGDGTTFTNKDVITHQYSSSGTYELSLTGSTDDYGGYTDTETVTVNIATSPPVAVIDASYEDGSDVYISDLITYDGSDSYDPDGTSLTYSWAIGQTASSSQEIVQDQDFNNLGEQDVTLTVTDESGATDSETNTYNVESRNPQASFTYNPQNPGPQEIATFNGSTSTHNEPKGEIVEYRWNFSNTSNQVDATGVEVDHSFPENNTEYEVTLTVEDQWGFTDQVTKTVKTDAYKSCHEFLEKRPDAQSGFYQLDPLETNNTIEVYCNMDYDGGGWTVIDKESFSEFSDQIGNTTDRGGDIQNWNVGPNNVYSYDGGGNHYFIYWIDTGFSFTEVRTNEITFGSASYRGGNDTSEVRGTNEATGNWDDLNSGGVSGDIAIGTKNSVFDAWSSHRNTDNWSAYTGSSSINTNRFHFRDVTYQKNASSIGVGWGESGGQVEGWEWETGEFMLREPVDEPDYFYNQGNNIKNFRLSSSSGDGGTSFNDTQVDMYSRNAGSEQVIISDAVDLSNHDTIYLGYVLTVEDGGSGYVEMEVGGQTNRDTINDTYSVNDRSMSIDVSNINSNSQIKITVHTETDNTTTSLEVDRVWGQGDPYTTISGSQYLTTTSGSSTFRHPTNESEQDELFSSGVTNEGYWNNSIHWDHNGEINAPEDDFGWKYEGWIYAPEAGQYRFGIDGDDAVDAFVGGQRVVSWYGGHSAQGSYRMGSEIYLEQGWHQLKVRHEEGGGSESVDLGWNTPSSGTVRVPSDRIAGSPQEVHRSEVNN